MNWMQDSGISILEIVRKEGKRLVKYARRSTMTDKAMAVFENYKHYDEETGTRYLSVIDIIAALIQQ